MEKITQKLSEFKEEKLDELCLLTTVENGLKFFLQYFDLEFFHKDMRGGKSNPNIILAAKGDFTLNDDFLIKIKKDFESNKNYKYFKKYLLTFGFFYQKHSNESYFYISCNVELLDKGSSVKKIKEIMITRCNRELFDHINLYFKK